MGERTGQLYCHSNGTEGMYFHSEFCEQCIHEKFMHTQRFGDKQCEIFNAAFLIADTTKEGFPKEWQYDENDRPTCTAFVKWDWNGNRDDEGGFIDPPEPEPEDPNQLCLPFIFDDIKIDEKIKILEAH